MWACAGDAARTRSRATARATRTRTARPATRARSSGAGPPSVVLAAMRAWRAHYGRLPSSYDWSRTHARRRGGEALERLSTGDWPSAGVVTAVCGSWKAARAAAAKQIVQAGDGDRRSRERWFDDTRPAGREVIANRDRTQHDYAGTGCAYRDSRPETLYLEGSVFRRRLKRSAVS